MDSPTSKKQNLLDFESFIRSNFSWYDFDPVNTKTIHNLDLWANRSEKFNNIEQNWHIDRGILLYGNFGSGKDEIFRLLSHYLRYLGSPYFFRSKIVWQFAGQFSTKDVGYKAFDDELTGNIYYEELALTDESSNYPSREVASYFGNKILVGNEIIHIRYNLFKRQGYQTHFSTNVTISSLHDIYGGRTVSRLREMCNFIPFVGPDRRGKSAPVFISNKNQVAPAQQKELSAEEEVQIKMNLEQHYQDYLSGNSPSCSLALIYNTLCAWGVNVCDDEAMRLLIEMCEKNFVHAPASIRASDAEREAIKKSGVWERARSIAVNDFFQKMKNSGAKSIFGIVNVDTGKMVDEIVGGVK